MIALGDRGYPLEPFMFTPIPNPVEDFEVTYNQLQVPARKIIERAFGVLKKTFQCIHSTRKLHYTPVKITRIINCCFILYNFMKIRNYALLEPLSANELEQFDEISYVTELEEAQNFRREYARRLI